MTEIEMKWFWEYPHYPIIESIVTSTETEQAPYGESSK